MSLIHGLNQTVRYGEEMEWRGDSREYSSVGSFMGQLYTPTTLLKKFSYFPVPSRDVTNQTQKNTGKPLTFFKSVHTVESKLFTMHQIC
jgi:hypothetical protein